LNSLRSEALIQTSGLTTIVQITNCISGSQGGTTITMKKVTYWTRVMLSAPPAGDDGPQMNSTGLTLDPVMWSSMRATMATMQMPMRRMQHRKPKMD
jgi:hypothetical protein